MTFKNLFAFVVAALILSGCSSKPQPVELNGQTLYLTSTTLHQSKYVQVAVNFKGNQVEIFETVKLKPMTGDVITGDYSFTGNSVSLPRLGTFTVTQTTEGYNLYSNGVLMYKLGKKMLPFVASI